jgi:CHAD domain
MAATLPDRGRGGPSRASPKRSGNSVRAGGQDVLKDRCYRGSMLGSDSPDTEWHAVRIRGNRCRYTAEAVAPICGQEAKRFAAAIAEVQVLRGEHQDTVVAEAWLRDGGAGAGSASPSRLGCYPRSGPAVLGADVAARP